MKAKLVQLSGRGTNLADCPPCYHVDFEPDEFVQFLSNPQGVLKQLGSDMTHTQITIGRPDEAWSHSKQTWVKLSPEEGNINTVKGCCYMSGGVIVCHKHYEN